MKQIIILLFLVAGFSACQPKSSTVRANVAPPLNTTGILGAGVINQCAQGVSNIGAIYDNGQMSATGAFEDRVKALLSATVNPQDVGSISGAMSDNTGVRFVGAMFLDASGNVIPAKSNMTISVYDSKWYFDQTNVKPIPLEFTTAKGSTISGQFSPATGQGYLSLKDNYGEIRFDGTFNTQTFTGTVSFTNNANVTGSAPASGSLGQFMINTCGIVQK